MCEDSTSQAKAKRNFKWQAIKIRVEVYERYPFGIIVYFSTSNTELKY